MNTHSLQIDFLHKHKHLVSDCCPKHFSLKMKICRHKHFSSLFFYKHPKVLVIFDWSVIEVLVLVGRVIFQPKFNHCNQPELCMCKLNQ